MAPPLKAPLLLLSTLTLQTSSFQPPQISKFLSPNSQKASSSNLQAKQTYIYDGGELQSFLLSNPSKNAIPSPRGAADDVGYVTFVTSKYQIGILADDKETTATSTIDNYKVYSNTMAKIPNGVSEADAMSTAAACLVGIDCAVPRLNVGGADDSGFYGGKAVVVGGNEYACFLAEGLAVLGIDTSIVSTGSVKLKHGQVNTLGPAVPSQDEEIGFTTAIGQFNTLIDTIANERSGSLSTDGSSVIQLLSTRHGCNTYISTLSKSQSIVKKEGLIFGPGKANAHVKALESKASSKCMSMIPSSGFGEMLQILLNSKVIYPSKSNKAIVTRGWSMKEFWEETSWPRDSNGSGVRFGMPVVEENDLDEVFRRERLALQRRRIVDDDEEEDDGAVAVQVKVEENPYVTQIVGTDGLAEAIINQRKSSVVFVSMRSCRTCKTINPVYTKIAREYEGDVMFAKADATGRVGKALGKSLGLISVPSFVLFRNGVRYGAVQTSKLPSDRLQKAINDLESGRDFDPACEVGDDD
ncbi:hypothetical protein ACHAXN_008266 [Cyclotella atomus]